MTSPSFVVAPVVGPAELDAFIRYPWEIYRDDPLWVPPLIPMQRDFLDRHKGPFFEFGQAEYFLARRDGRIVGRISAHLNGLYEEHHDKDTGFFGFFECENRQETADAAGASSGRHLHSSQIVSMNRRATISPGTIPAMKSLPMLCSVMTP